VTSLHAAEGAQRRPLRRASRALPAEKPSRDVPVPPFRFVVRGHGGQWEERFEGRHGFWRGFVDEQVWRYPDCGLLEKGFARVQWTGCHEEYLFAFSCKTRELCTPAPGRNQSSGDRDQLWRHERKFLSLTPNRPTASSLVKQVMSTPVVSGWRVGLLSLFNTRTVEGDTN